MTTTPTRRPSTSDLRHKLATEFRQLVAIWRAASARIHRPRRCVVTAIECGRCRRWVKPRHYSLRYRACPACTRIIAEHYRAQLRAHRAHIPAQP